MIRTPPSLSRPLARVVRERLADAAPAAETVLDYLRRHAEYDRLFARRLEALARDAAASWPLRRAAALMLEGQLLRIPADDAGEWRRWLERLGIGGRHLARDGWAAGDLAPQLRARLARLSRLHDSLRGLATPPRVLADFLHTASKECRLTLGRYLWSAGEIVARIEQNVRRSRGLRSATPELHPGFHAEAERTMTRILPPLEEEIVRLLGRDAVIRWAARDTPDDINSLVEYPVGTVVLTIKPPGGHHEIEIKRAGTREDNALDVAWTRNGWLVASTHHLHGGSGEHSLAWEAASSALLSRFYRAVHGREAPISRTLFIAYIYGIPSRRGEVHPLDYFTDPRVFGSDHAPMRRRLELALGQLARYEGTELEPTLNDLATTAEFIGAVRPGQAIEVGTTSFRLDKVARYLAPGGAQELFTARGRPYRGEDARLFVDELLDEILCTYEPPATRWRSHRSYVEAAFRVPANRRRANENYRSAMTQVGHFWGTLLAARGCSGGESFVVRNCGLRSVWEDGRWQLRVVFLDHDSLHLTGRNSASFDALTATRGAWKDAKHILGGRLGKRRIKGEFGFLRDIFRVTNRVEREGVAAFRAAAKSAYDFTLDRMQSEPAIRSLFHARFLDRLRDWDELVAGWLRSGSSSSARRAWRREATASLQTKAYDEHLIRNHFNAIKRDWQFLRRMSFLWSREGAQ
jgi:hypothetical protein